ncbi:MAG: selenide, water dikinase SelD, partial [Prochlorococcus sp.]
LGRVRTTNTLQVINNPHLFAVGDCGVIDAAPRPASGVWAVRAAKPLAQNLERCGHNLPTRSWKPQARALQLLGSKNTPEMSTAWAIWGDLMIGPHPWLWRWKQIIDRRFMALFKELSTMSSAVKTSANSMACRGCAAKLAAKPLNEALKQAGLEALGKQPQDAAFIATTPTGESLLQSVDGFPALVSDPWLNGRLTTLHACSDLWASGAQVISAQAVITLPMVPSKLQQELLTQTLVGIQSALNPQGAQLIGGHSLEARSLAPQPSSLGLQVSLSVNGKTPAGHKPWDKGNLQSGDVLLLSRSLGSGVLFAAAMTGEVSPQDLDAALAQMTVSQHNLLELLHTVEAKDAGSSTIHACSDITGFGLLGHLGEMLNASNFKRYQADIGPLHLTLEAQAIPSLQGALKLLKEGFSSTLAPANRRNWRLLEPNTNKEAAPIEILWGDIAAGHAQRQALLELMVDPQTCGPLLVACSTKIAAELLSDGPWQRIGQVQQI